MEAAHEQCIEHIFNFVGDSNIAADQRHAVATANLVAGAGYRHIEIANPARNDTGCKRSHPIGITCAHAEDNLARAIAERRQELFLDNILDLLGVEHSNDDATRRFGQICNRGHGTTANLPKSRAPRGVNVKSGDGNAGFDQPARIDLAH